MVIKGSGLVKDPLRNNITSHFEECGVNELDMHHVPVISTFGIACV